MATSSRLEPLKLVILISGSGSNMLAIAAACREKRIRAKVSLVISDNEEGISIGLAAARTHGIETARIPWPGAQERAQFEEELALEIQHARADLIILAGFMRVLSGAFVQRYAGTMLNIHPSLLPHYKGLDTHRRVLEAGATEHGASVHFVTPELDSGPVVLQSRIKVRHKDTAETLHARVLKTEHEIYPRVIGWIADGKLQWREDGVWLDGQPLTAPVIEEFG